jgi:hypothetical protein
MLLRRLYGKSWPIIRIEKLQKRRLKNEINKWRNLDSWNKLGIS